MTDVKVPPHIERISEEDIEQTLSKTLTSKYGTRFSEYRSAYTSIIEASGPIDVLPMPVTLGIELLNKCNFKCSMCLTPKLDEPKIVIQKSVRQSLLEQIKKHKIPAVMFGMGEEPLLYKDFVEFVREISEAGVMDIFLFTNGLLMNETISQALIDLPITRVYFSLDAATPETFFKVRGKNELPRVEENILKFLEIRDAKKSKLPIVRVSFCLTENNAHEKDMFIEKWRHHVDHVDIQTVHDFSRVQEMSRMSNEELFAPTEKSVAGAKRNQPWEKLTVWANGDVSPCCTFHGKNLIIGNVNLETVDELWNGEKITKVRDQVASGKLNPVCHECLSKRGL